MNFMSPVKQVDGIWIQRLPVGKPVKVERVVSAGRVVLLQAENGRLYSPMAKDYCYLPGCFDGHQADWFKALKAMRLLTAKQVADHKTACDRKDKAREQRYAANALARAAKDYGLPLTKAQLTFIAKHGDKEPQA